MSRNRNRTSAGPASTDKAAEQTSADDQSTDATTTDQTVAPTTGSDETSDPTASNADASPKDEAGDDENTDTDPNPRNGKDTSPKRAGKGSRELAANAQAAAHHRIEKSGGLVTCTVVGPGGVWSGGKRYRVGQTGKFPRSDVATMPQLRPVK